MPEPVSNSDRLTEHERRELVRGVLGGCVHGEREIAGTYDENGQVIGIVRVTCRAEKGQAIDAAIRGVGK